MDFRWSAIRLLSASRRFRTAWRGVSSKLSEHPPGALRSLHHPVQRPVLGGFSLSEISTELLARLDAGEEYLGDESLLIAEQLQQSLCSRINVHTNRFSAQ